MPFAKQNWRYSVIHPRYLANRELRNLINAEREVIRGILLDVGCGEKPYQALLSNVTRYIGIDIPTSIHGSTHIDVNASASNIPFMDASFDCVLCTEVLEHTPEPLIVLREIFRVVKSDGYLLLTVPFSEQLHEEPHDYYRFTPYSLEYLLKQSGWDILRIRNRGGTWLELGYRLSSFLYTSIGANRDPSGYLHMRPILGPLIVILTMMVQICSLILDKLWRSDLSTIGYGILAQKRDRRISTLP